MTTTSITVEQLQQVIATASNPSYANNPAITWQLLASFGDQYAQAAYDGLAVDGSFYNVVIRESNSVSGVSPTQATQLMQKVLAGYVSILGSTPLSSDGTIRLPSTGEIERNYLLAANSLHVSDLSPIDLSITRIVHGLGSILPNWYNWSFGVGLNLDPARVSSTPSEVNNSINFSDALGHLFITSFATAVTLPPATLANYTYGGQDVSLAAQLTAALTAQSANSGGSASVSQGIAGYLASSLTKSAIANAIGYQSTGSSSAFMMMGELAYPPLNVSGGGASAMALLGQDLLILDEALTDAGGSSVISSSPIENALVELAVQFAGDAAASGGLAAGAQGVFNNFTSSMLSANIDPSDFPSTFSIGNSTIVGEIDLIDAALSNALSITPTSTVGNGAQADRAVMNFVNDNNMTTIDIALGGGAIDTTSADPSSGAIVVGRSGSGTVTLGDGNNLVFGGQTVKVGNGDNLIFAEGGGETVTVGGGNNEVIAAGTGNKINIETAGHTGINVVYAGSGNDTVNFDVGSEGYAGFVVLPLQGFSLSALADLDAKALELAVSKEVAQTNWSIYEPYYTNGLHDFDWTVIVTAPGSSLNGDQITMNGAPITTYTIAGSTGNGNMTGTATNPMANPTENTDIALPSDYGPVYTFVNGALSIYDTTEFIPSLALKDYLTKGNNSSTSDSQSLLAPSSLMDGATSFTAANAAVPASEVTASATEVSTKLDALNADPNLASITLTDSGTPTLNLTAAQVADDVVALNTITNPSYSINVTDSAANVSANFDGVAGNANIASITLTDSGTPTLDLTVTQFEEGYYYLMPGGAISNSAYNIQISDSVANITDGYYAQDLASNPNVVGATVVDTVAHILDNASAIAADSLVTSVEISDTVANVLANQSAIAALPFSVSSELNDTAADIAAITPAQAAALAADGYTTLTTTDGVVTLTVAETLTLENAGLTITGATVTVEDTSANIAANLDALNSDTSVSSVTVTDNWWSPSLTLTASQTVNDGAAQALITNKSVSINVSDDAANVSEYIVGLNNNPNIASITLTDSGAPTLILNVGEDLSCTTALDDITNSNPAVVVEDSAANVSAKFLALNQSGQFTSITLTDSGVPNLNLDAADAANGSNVLGAITNANFSVAVTDSAANVAAFLDELNLLPNLSSITLTDSGTPTLTLTVAQALGDSALNSIKGNYQIVVADTGANIDANLPALNADKRISAIDVVSSGTNPTFKNSTPSTVENGQSTVIGVVQAAVAGDALSLTQVAGSLGTVTLGAPANGGQQILYTAPTAISSSAEDNVSYTISEANGGSITETAAIQLDAGPTAGVGSLTIGHSQSENITDLLTGLVTPGRAGDVETLTSVSATFGAATLSNGVATFIAPAGGSSTISYTVADQLGDTATGTVAVTVDPGPTAKAGALTIGHGESENVTSLLNGLVTPGLVGDVETLTSVSATAGTISLVNGVATYVAPTSGAGSISYTVADQLGDTATGIVAVTIDPGPTAKAGTLTIGHGESENVTSLLNGLVTPGLTGDVETLTSASATAGTISLFNGVATYVAPASGTGSISYTIADQLGDTATGTVAVTVDPGPTTAAVASTVNLGQSVNLTSSILSAATPGLKGDTLTIVSDNAANTIGTVALVNGVLTYTATSIAFPNIPANGTATDSFAYAIADQYGDTATGTVKVSVTNPVTAINGPAYGGGTIQGPAGASAVINANGYNNTIYANGGNDVINAGSGNATVYTGAGNVVVNLNGYYDNVSGGDGADSVSGSSGNATVTLGNGNDSVTTSGYSNAIRLGNGNNTVVAGAGNDTVTLGSGANNVTLSGYWNTVTAGNGANAVTGGQGNETITLGNGNDTVTTSGYSNTIKLGNGNNVVTAGSGSDTVIAGSGNDTVNLSGWSNIVTLGSGTDVVNGGQGGDVITLSGGTKTLNLSGGSEHVVLNSGVSAKIFDTGGNLRVDIGSSTGTDVISGFANDASGWIDLVNGAGGYSSVNQVMQALHSDGSGGTLLSLGPSGSIDFAGVAPSQLRASSFAVG